MSKLTKSGNEEIAYRSKMFEIIKRPMKVGNKILEFEIAKRSPGVRLLIIKKGKILLTKEFRYELDEYDYRLPGGKVFDSLEEYNSALKKDIMPFAIRAAKKECLEETGLIPNKIRYFQTSQAGATIIWDLFYFIVEDFTESKKQSLEHGEVIRPEWKTFKEAKELCLNGKIKEDRTIGILLKFLMREKPL